MNDDLLSRYQQAQTLVQGVLSKQLVLNDAVFPHWISNSDYLWYERETREGKEYRLVDAKTEKNNIAFDHRALARALKMASGESINDQNLPIRITEIILSPRQVKFQAFGKDWVFDLEKMSCKEIELPPDNGLRSPDGRQVAFVRNYNLWVRDIANGKERNLTKDGAINHPYSTVATPFGEPSTSAVQAIWSPDSLHIFTHQLDIKKVTSRSIVRHVPQDGSIRPKISEYKSAYPGDKHIETYYLCTIEVKTGKIQAVNYKGLPLSRFGGGFFSEEKFGWWASDSQRVFFVDVTRGSKTVRIVDYNTRSRSTRVLFEESSDTFVKLSHDMFDHPLFLPLPNSNELVWFSERSGWGHLYLYDLNSGELVHSLTEGEWLVRNVVHADIERRELWVQTAARDPNSNPYYRDICRINLDTREITPLIFGPYDHLVFTSTANLIKVRASFGLDASMVSGVSPNGNYCVTTRSRVDEMPVSILIDRDGKEVLLLEEADFSNHQENWQWPKPVNIKSADGRTDLYGVVYQPPGFSQDKRYPVLDFSCGHPGFSCIPHASFVNGPIYGDAYLTGLAYAALGFVVVAIEGRGTPYRQKKFQDESFGSMTSVNFFEDRIAGLKQLTHQFPHMDLERVGIVAYDGMTSPLYGLLEHPDFYKVGVMLALEDARFGPASMVEMFENLNLFSETSYPEALVASLKGKLLVIHGLLDSVTPPAATFRLIDALQKNNKDFDMLLLPSMGHDIPRYVLRRTWDYFVEHLQNQKPPKEFKVITGWDLL